MASAYSFNGKVALVTGGGSGIGRAVCQLLARDGARVLVTDLNLKGAQETLKLMPGSGNHLALQMDVTRRDAVEAVIAAARKEFGAPPSLLVNSAGVGARAPFEDVKEDRLSVIIDVNLKGTFFVTQAFTKALLENKQESEEEAGAVVNIASLRGKCGMIFGSHYAATKGGVIALTKSCAAELAGKGVRVNSVLPGLIDTPMMALARTEEEKKAYLQRTTPLGRSGRPEETQRETADEDTGKVNRGLQHPLTSLYILTGNGFRPFRQVSTTYYQVNQRWPRWWCSCCRGAAATWWGPAWRSPAGWTCDSRRLQCPSEKAEQ